MNKDLERLKELYPDYELIDVTKSERLRSDSSTFVAADGFIDLDRRMGSILYRLSTVHNKDEKHTAGACFEDKVIFYTERKGDLYLYYLIGDTIDNFR